MVSMLKLNRLHVVNKNKWMRERLCDFIRLKNTLEYFYFIGIKKGGIFIFEIYVFWGVD